MRGKFDGKKCTYKYQKHKQRIRSDVEKNV